MGCIEEERELEIQLELQLQEQKESLAAINAAVASDPFNLELTSVQEELALGIRDAEESLLHLKRSRLSREADLVLCDFSDPTLESFDKCDTGNPDDSKFLIGSKCRFRYVDGRWYNGVIVHMETNGKATISFLNPTAEKMLMCKFFLQQRCRYGSSCRMSHGVDLPINSLKRYIPTLWDQSKVGSNVWAVSDNGVLWKEGELASWDETLNRGRVVFREDGRNTVIESGKLTLSAFAIMSDEEEEGESELDSDSSEEEEEESAKGLGFHEATQSEVETSKFAKWERHTRGMASKMMAKMGYREGMGLGMRGQGIVAPISVHVLPAKQSLDHALELQKSGSVEKRRRSRGGKRKREKKMAEALRAQVEEEKDVFSLINDHLAKHQEALGGRIKEVIEMKVERKSLVAYEEEVKELKERVARYEEMATRNRKEKAVYEVAISKLEKARTRLAAVEAASAAVSDALSRKENEKKWLKF